MLREAITTATRYANAFNQLGIHELSHLQLVGGERHQREHSERKLHAQNHLAEHKKLRSSALAVHDGHNCRRNDRDHPRYQSPQPGTDADVEEPFHYDLTGKRAGESRILSRREQCQREYRARSCAKERRQQLVCILDLADVAVSGRMECRGGNDQDRSVYEQRE
jgi:hypothetical protein